MKREKKAILNNLENLVRKYGFLKVRATINGYFILKREEQKAKKEIANHERIVQKLKQKLKR